MRVTAPGLVEPGGLETDASVLESTHLAGLEEQGDQQFQFDFLNLLDRSNLAWVDHNLTGGSWFGTVDTASSARAVQLGVSF